MRIPSTLLTLSIVLFLPTFAFAQTAGPELVFRSQLVELHSKAITVLDLVEKAGPRGLPRQRTLDEIFTLVRFVHQLEEEAASEDLQFVKRGHPSSITLLLVRQASKSIDVMLAALSNYVESGDRAFLGFARDNNALVWSVRKVI